jgi:membrane protease subunit (stomatin/prohibitin family)
MNLRVRDARRLLIKVVGTESDLTQPALVQKFRAFLMTKVKTYIANYLTENSINIFEIDQKLTEMSGSLHEMLVPDFNEYGISLVHFFVTTIAKPEEDGAYRKFKELHFRQYADIVEAKIRQNVGIIDQQIEAQRMVIESQGLAQKRQIEGYTYAQERGFDVAETVAGNEGSGNMANLGIGLGIMTGVGTTVGGVVNQAIGGAMNPQANNAAVICQKCNASVPANAKFCMECGEKVETLGVDEIICPVCGKKTVKGKFCTECGTTLVITCPKCENELPSGAKFCLGCGEKIGGDGHE